MADKDDKNHVSPRLERAYQRYLLFLQTERSLNVLSNLCICLCLSVFSLGLVTYGIDLPWYGNGILLIISFVGALKVLWKPSLKIKSLKLISTALEIRHSHTKYPLSAYRQSIDAEFNQEWGSRIDALINEFRRHVFVRVRRQALKLFASVVLLGLVWQPAMMAGRKSFASLRVRVQPSLQTAELRIIKGNTQASGSQKSVFSLSPKQAVELDLLEENLLSVEIRIPRQSMAPLVHLHQMSGQSEGSKKIETEVYQSFRMLKVSENSECSEHLQALDTYHIRFLASKSVALKIPVISESAVLALMGVEKLPVPEIELSAVSEIRDPWHDEDLLSLKIIAHSTSPMERVELRIRVGRHEATELVNKIDNTTTTQFSSEYELLLEPYLKEDLAQVEIVAVAIDRTKPAPLIGYSQAIRLNTESSYGRYRQTLRALRDLKGDLDAVTEQGKTRVPEKSLELAEKALTKSMSTSFFDTLDRIQIGEFTNKLRDLVEVPSYEEKASLQEELDEFLIEHEILDDRERDRDFFVAARAFSRLIEQEPEKRPIGVDRAAKNLQAFIETRRGRWKLRVANLQDPSSLSQWPLVENEKPFIKGIEASAQPLRKNLEKSVSLSLMALTKTLSEYRSWIEALEKFEDQERGQKEQKRQEGLASAREMLRALQKRQGKISADLDQARDRESQALDDRWPVTRMQQNENIKQTRRLEAQLKSLSPRAGARIEASLEAMRETLKLGEDSKYVQSESYSDLASRLLRSAEKESSKSQKGRSRSRKRVTGDQYYGQSVHGGDLEISRDYQVDRRYREDILNEIQQGSYSDENKALMETYLRQIIR